MRCAKCGNAISDVVYKDTDGATYCVTCAATLAARSETDLREEHGIEARQAESDRSGPKETGRPGNSLEHAEPGRAVETIFCWSCGAQLPLAARSCPKCGAAAGRVTHSRLSKAI